MIVSIRHKALRKFWSTGNTKGLNSAWFPRLQIIMDALEAADDPEEMNFPGMHFHALRGDLTGFYSVRLTGNYRVIFQHDGDGFVLVDIVDYH